MKSLIITNNIGEISAQSDKLSGPVLGITRNMTVFSANKPKSVLNYLCFVAEEDHCIIKLSQRGKDNTNYEFETSNNGESWSSYILDTDITLNKGDKVYWRGNNDHIGLNYFTYKHFIMSGKISSHGNINSLLSSNFDSIDTIPTPYCYGYMFIGCDSLISAPELLSTTLTVNCYSNLFNGCINLVTAPELPATALASLCYNAMFEGCKSLVNMPNLPAIILESQCYASMFKGCESLTSVISLPATTLARGCYEYMFSNCINLTNVNDLLATNLQTFCYRSMFEGCINLLVCPKLPATTLSVGCYCGMFANCCNIQTAPELPAENLVSYCYCQMFYGCSKLNYIKTMFIKESSSSYMMDWVFGVSSSGTFVKTPSAIYSTGTSGIPSGWIVKTVNS